MADITGQRYERLTAIRRVDDYVSPSGNHIARWLCKCDCGNETIILRNAWRHTKSCGCLQSEKASMLTKVKAGQRYGKWTALKPVPLEKPQANGVKTGWLCRCDCGTERVVTAKLLNNGESRSCGCETVRKANERLSKSIGRYDGTAISKLTTSAPTKASKTGVRGVYWSKREKKFIAKIGVKGKAITIGRYDNLEDATEARKDAEEKYYQPIIDRYNKEEHEK